MKMQTGRQNWCFKIGDLKAGENVHNFLGLIGAWRKAQNFKPIAQPVLAFQELSADQKMGFLGLQMAEI